MTGRLGTLNITNVNVDTLLYTCPTGKTASFSVNFCNRNNTAVRVRLALTDALNITDDEYLAFNQWINPNEFFEKSGLVLGQGQNVYVQSNTTAVSVVIMGYEE